MVRCVIWMFIIFIFYCYCYFKGGGLAIAIAICITETRLYDESSLTEINIPGYDFLHTPTTTQCGGAGIYIKSTPDYDYEVLKKYTASHIDICETIFIELKNKNKKNMVIGCIYRHHTPIRDFCSTYLDSTLRILLNQKRNVPFSVISTLILLNMEPITT